MDKETLKFVNQYLKSELGIVIGNKPLYRIIWSTGITEKRRGLFRDFYGHILIREVVEIRTVLKYPRDQDRWIFERLEINDNAEVMEKFSYEPLFVFKDKLGNYLPLNIKAVEFIVGMIKRPPRFSDRRTELEEEEERKEKEEVAKFLDIIDDGARSALFAYGDTVSLNIPKRDNNG